MMQLKVTGNASRFTSLILFILLTGATLCASSGIVIIANPETQIDTLDRKELKDIFTGKKTRWGENGKIVIAVLKDSELHKHFLRKYVKKTPSQFRNFWRRKVFTGEGSAPKTFTDRAELIEFVARTKGAVGYITPPAGSSVKVIAINEPNGGCP